MGSPRRTSTALLEEPRRAPQAATSGYALCGTPRSGSTYLCALLASTDQLGRPNEYFAGPVIRLLFDPAYPDHPAEQAKRILRDGATANGIYGVKIFAEHFDFVTRTIALDDALPDLRFVRLKRRDALGQALSWVRARQTEQYLSGQPVQGAAKYDPPLIMSCLRTLARDETAWDRYFQRTGIQVLNLVYEDVIADPDAAVTGVARWVGVTETVRAHPRMTGMDIQRDVLTEFWRDRFVREYGNPNTARAL